MPFLHIEGSNMARSTRRLHAMNLFTSASFGRFKSLIIDLETSSLDMVGLTSCLCLKFGIRQPEHFSFLSTRKGNTKFPLPIFCDSNFITGKFLLIRVSATSAKLWNDISRIPFPIANLLCSIPSSAESNSNLRFLKRCVCCSEERRTEKKLPSAKTALTEGVTSPLSVTQSGEPERELT
ncbi:hypothetical protein V8G54_010291 [Vigna mungo]|uniref:Uncharacterized protein n=1 Tax=Vigna mungo TaxID=3915 RepID=A0AAQ3NWE1_VIGMU